MSDDLKINDPNAADADLIRKLWERDGVFVEPGESLTESQKNVIREKIAERKRLRQVRMQLRLRESARRHAEDYEARHGMGSYTGDKWWEREMSPVELAEYRSERELIETRRFEAMVEKERERYRNRP